MVDDEIFIELPHFQRHANPNSHGHGPNVNDLMEAVMTNEALAMPTLIETLSPASPPSKILLFPPLIQMPQPTLKPSPITYLLLPNRLRLTLNLPLLHHLLPTMALFSPPLKSLLLFFHHLLK